MCTARSLHPQTPQPQPEAAQGSGRETVCEPVLFQGQLCAHTCAIDSHVRVKCAGDEIASNTRNKPDGVFSQALTPSLSPSAPEVPPSEVSGGGGSRSELVITWDVSVGLPISSLGPAVPKAVGAPRGQGWGPAISSRS